MKWENLPKRQANEILHSWTHADLENKFCDFIKSNLIKNKQYCEIRNEIIDIWNKNNHFLQKNAEKSANSKYLLDLNLGINLYKVFLKYNMTSRFASNDEIWNFLTVQIFPDIVSERWPKDDSKTVREPRDCLVNVDRFIAKRRNYLKTLWWYVFLSLQNKDNSSDLDCNECINPDFDKTYEILSRNSTDTIVQLVERSGNYGYRVGFSRILMRYYYDHCTNKEQNSKSSDYHDFFRKIMVLNTAKLKIIEPDLMENGALQYVKMLFKIIANE